MEILFDTDWNADIGGDTVLLCCLKALSEILHPYFIKANIYDCPQLVFEMDYLIENLTHPWFFVAPQIVVSRQQL